MCPLRWLRDLLLRWLRDLLLQWLRVVNGNGRDIKYVGVGNGRGFKYIPDELVVEILRRLPAEQLWRCRRVCARWNALISSRYFVQAHLQRASSTVFVFYLLKCKWPLDYKTKFMDFFSPMDHDGDEYAKASCSTIIVMKRVFNGSLAKRWKRQMQDFVALPVASCNGLVLFYSSFSSTLHVGNPITGELISIRHPFSEERICGFFYHSSTQKYNLLLCHRRVTNGPIEYEILTLGSMVFRSVGTFPYIPRDGSPVIVNNTLYWMIADTSTCANSIMMFFMDSENFYTLSHPRHPCEPRHHKLMHLLGMEGRLTWWCLWADVVRVWVLEVSENHIGHWTQIYDLNFYCNFNSYPFIPDDANDQPQVNHDIQLVSIQNTELLLVWRMRGVFRYNLLTNTVRKVELEGIKQFHYSQGHLLMTSYTKSVVSLMNFASGFHNINWNRSLLKKIRSTISNLKNKLATALLD